MKNISTKHIMLLIGCMLIQAIPYGLAQNVPPLYITPLTEAYGFKLQEVSLLFTVGAVFAAVVSPVAGKFFGKTSTKILMLIAIAIATLGFGLQVFATQMWMFYVANCLIQAGCIVFSGLAVPYLIGSWFDETNRATAMGIAFSGGSIGNFFLQPIFSTMFNKAVSKASITNLEPVQSVFFVIAAAFVILGVAIILIFIRDNKEDLTPDQTYGEQMKEAIEEASGEHELGCGFAITSKVNSFWLMGIAMLIIGLNISAQSAMYNNFFNSIHLSEQIGEGLFAFIGSMFALGCLVGNVVGGVLFSKLGIFKSVVIGGLMQLISGLAMLLLSVDAFQTGSWLVVLPYAWAIFYGLSVFMYTSGPSVIIQTLFGMKDFGQTVGVFNIFFAVGFAIGTFLFSIIQGSVGWTYAWVSIVVYVVIGYILMLLNVKKVQTKDYAHMS